MHAANVTITYVCKYIGMHATDQRLIWDFLRMSLILRVSATFRVFVHLIIHPNISSPPIKLGGVFLRRLELMYIKNLRFHRHLKSNEPILQSLKEIRFAQCFFALLPAVAPQAPHIGAISITP